MLKYISNNQTIALAQFRRKTMNKNELSQTINRSVKELGFARIARSAIIDVFSTGNPVSFDIHNEIQEFAADQGFEFQNDGEDFVVFRLSNTE
jgi:hypothetical protein